MKPVIAVPKVKKVEYESVWFRSTRVTKVYFKNGTALTFAGLLSKKEATFNAYYQKARDMGLTVEEAATMAGKGS